MNEKAKELMDRIKKIDKLLDNADFICTKTDEITKYDFNNFMLPTKFASKIHNRNITLQEAKDDQLEIELLINNLNNSYNPGNEIK